MLIKAYRFYDLEILGILSAIKSTLFLEENQFLPRFKDVFTWDFMDYASAIKYLAASSFYTGTSDMKSLIVFSDLITDECV